MSYAEQLQRLAQVRLEPESIDGEAFHRTLEPLLTQLYRVNRLLCRRASRRAGAPPPRPA
jgi:hypothetical protein